MMATKELEAVVRRGFVDCVDRGLDSRSPMIVGPQHCIEVVRLECVYVQAKNCRYLDTRFKHFLLRNTSRIPDQRIEFDAHRQYGRSYIGICSHGYSHGHRALDYERYHSKIPTVQPFLPITHSSTLDLLSSFVVI